MEKISLESKPIEKKGSLPKGEQALIEFGVPQEKIKEIMEQGEIIKVDRFPGKNTSGIEIELLGLVIKLGGKEASYTIAKEPMGNDFIFRYIAPSQDRLDRFLSRQRSLEQKNVLLSYKDFLSKMGNFYCHFHSAPDYESYRNTSHYQKFASENPELAKEILEEMDKLVAAKERNPIPEEDSPYFPAQGKGYGTIFSEMTDLPIMPLLYKAYKKMRLQVESDQNLFQ